MTNRSRNIWLSIFAVLALAIGIGTFDFVRWRADITQRIEGDPDRRIASTALGDVEYAVVGEGTPILTLHGSPGGFDQSLAARRVAPEVMTPGVKTIAVSRPGYLGTPLSSGASYEEQADLFAALLDELAIDRVIVLGASAGGPAALQFALRHPDRTLGLVLFSAGTRSETEPGGSAQMGKGAMLAFDMAVWAAARFFPAAVFDGYDADNPVHVALSKGTLESTVPTRLRAAGNGNEFIQYQKPAIDDWPLHLIQAPTLIVHGDADARASYEHAQHAAERIPDSRLVTFEGDGHEIYITKRAEVQGHLTQFIQELGLAQ